MSNFLQQKSFSNKVFLDQGTWHIVKQFADQSSYTKEIQFIGIVNNSLNQKITPEIISTNNDRMTIVYKYAGNCINQSWDPEEELYKYDLSENIVSILGKIHQNPVPKGYNDNSWESYIIWSKKYLWDNLYNEMIEFLSEFSMPQGLYHWDFSLNNLLENNWNITVIDWEYAGYGNQSLDIVKFFRSIMWDDSIVNHAISVYNKYSQYLLTRKDLIQIFVWQAAKNLSDQNASWKYLSKEERKIYREKLNQACISNIKSLIFQGVLSHREF